MHKSIVLKKKYKKKTTEFKSILPYTSKLKNLLAIYIISLLRYSYISTMNICIQNEYDIHILLKVLYIIY